MDWDENDTTFPEEDKQAFSSIGFDVAGYIGRGAYGKVFNGICNEKASKSYEVQSPVGFDGTQLWSTGKRQMRDVSLNGRPFAIKWIRPNAKKNVLKEGSVLMDLNHPNVVEILFVAKMQYKNSYIIMEYLNGGTLREHMKVVKDSGKSFEEYEFKNMIVDLIEGLKYLHSKRVVHKDIHALNVMYEVVDLKDPNSTRIHKYVDFNLAEQLTAFPQDMFDEMSTHDLLMLSYLFDRIEEMTTFRENSLQSDFKAIATKMRTKRFKNIDLVYNELMEALSKSSRSSSLTSTSSANN